MSGKGDKPEVSFCGGAAGAQTRSGVVFHFYAMKRHEAVVTKLTGVIFGLRTPEAKSGKTKRERHPCVGGPL
jgi:hypothetical protein